MNPVKGNALVEFTLGLTLMIPFFIWSIQLLHFWEIRFRSLNFVQVGTDLKTSGVVTPDTVNSVMAQKVTELEKSNIQLSWTQNRFLDTPASHFYNLITTKIDGRGNYGLAFSEQSTSVQME